MKKQMQYAREHFRRRILTDSQYRHWVLVQMYGHQTYDERAEKRRMHHNEVGFRTFDDKVLTGLAEKHLDGEPLTAQDEQQLCERLPKYWRQFLVIKLARPQVVQANKRKKTASSIIDKTQKEAA